MDSVCYCLSCFAEFIKLGKENLSQCGNTRDLLNCIKYVPHIKKKLSHSERHKRAPDPVFIFILKVE